MGHIYRVAIRTVDLAGNSVPFSEKELAPPESATSRPSLPCGSSPYRRRSSCGATSTPRASRSSTWSSAPIAESRPRTTRRRSRRRCRPGRAYTYAEDSQRHLAPAEGFEQMAESGREVRHADAAPGRRHVALRTALREEGTFLDLMIVDIATGQKTTDRSRSSSCRRRPLPTRGAWSAGGRYRAGRLRLVPRSGPGAPVPARPPGDRRRGHGLRLHRRRGLTPAGGLPRHAWPELKAPPSAPPRDRRAIASLVACSRCACPSGRDLRLSSVFPEDRLEGPRDLAMGRGHGRTPSSRPLRRRTPLDADAVPPGDAYPRRPATVARAGDDGGRCAPLGRYVRDCGLIANHARAPGRLDVFGEWTEDVDLSAG